MSLVTIGVYCCWRRRRFRSIKKRNMRFTPLRDGTVETDRDRENFEKGGNVEKTERKKERTNGEIKDERFPFSLVYERRGGGERQKCFG